MARSSCLKGESRNCLIPKLQVSAGALGRLRPSLRLEADRGRYACGETLDKDISKDTAGYSQYDNNVPVLCDWRMLLLSDDAELVSCPRGLG